MPPKLSTLVEKAGKDRVFTKKEANPAIFLFIPEQFFLIKIRKILRIMFVYFFEITLSLPSVQKSGLKELV